jgi:uncharacterized LabA/DUF88 family protein
MAPMPVSPKNYNGVAGPTFFEAVVMPEKMVAVLMDAGHLWKIGHAVINADWDTSKFIDLAHACVDSPKEAMFRIFFYDCFPYGGTSKNPMSKEFIDYKNNNFYKQRSALLNALAQSNYVALRRGALKMRGWTLRKKAIEKLMSGEKTSVSPSDITENFQQKSVDMKIGIDVAWMASRHIVDRIIIIGNDTDYIPAMKHARREGVQVVIVGFSALSASPNKKAVIVDLLEHADEYRIIKYHEGKFLIDR